MGGSLAVTNSLKIRTAVESRASSSSLARTAECWMANESTISKTSCRVTFRPVTSSSGTYMIRDEKERGRVIHPRFFFNALSGSTASLCMRQLMRLFTRWKIHCQTCQREISAVAESSTAPRNVKVPDSW